MWECVWGGGFYNIFNRIYCPLNEKFNLQIRIYNIKSCYKGLITIEFY